MTHPPSRTGRPWRRLVAQVLATQGTVCHLCHLDGATSADHLLPVSMGGAIYDLANLAPVHPACNYKRGTKPVAQARRELNRRQPAGYLNDGTGRYRNEDGLITSRKW